MRTRAVIMIVGAHDADNIAGRPTAPVPDRSCPGRTLAALGRGRGQLTPALLGVG